MGSTTLDGLDFARCGMRDGVPDLVRASEKGTTDPTGDGHRRCRRIGGHLVRHADFCPSRSKADGETAEHVELHPEFGL